MPPLRILHDDPASGTWNMAVDEALAESVAANGVPALRFYTWAEPTLSLGYFQRAGDRAEHPASLACPLVRRASGGGAIVHDRELTYCLVLPLASPHARRPRELYFLVHGSLQRLMAEHGVALELNLDVSPAAPFLCFQRRAEGDVLLGAQKIAGSAQRRHSGAVAQHGSILLARSAHAPELPGIAEISRRSFAPEEIAARWESRLADELGFSPERSALSDNEHVAAEKLVTAKFAAPTWNEKR